MTETIPAHANRCVNCLFFEGKREGSGYGECHRYAPKPGDMRGEAKGVKPGRGGSALPVGMLTCARCGHSLTVSCGGRAPAPCHGCRSRRNEGRKRCQSFGGRRVEKAVVGEVLQAVSPLAERRHAACGPDCCLSVWLDGSPGFFPTLSARWISREGGRAWDMPVLRLCAAGLVL